MILSIGIVGLPNAGKSTLFNALTNAGVSAANYPFATIEPNVGVVPVPDRRLEGLAELAGSAKATPATVRFVDIAGLVRGASAGEGLGNQFLANIRDVAAICHVVRAFHDLSVAHVEDVVDPIRDIGIVNTELALADLETIDRRLPRLTKEATADRTLASQVDNLEAVRARIASGEMVGPAPDLADLNLLTAKPVIYLFNSDYAVLADQERQAGLAASVAPAETLFLDAELEAELAALGEEERTELAAVAGLEEPGLDRLIGVAYRVLGLQSFLTANPNETRAWTISSGATSLEAAGEVHTDFARGFIAAEVVPYETLVEAGSWQAARAAGLVRSEGKTYVMRPDDVVEFRFNT